MQRQNLGQTTQKKYSNTAQSCSDGARKAEAQLDLNPSVSCKGCERQQKGFSKSIGGKRKTKVNMDPAPHYYCSVRPWI